MPDNFHDAQPNILSAAESFEVFVTVGGDITFAARSREITVGTPGDLKLLMKDGSQKIIPSAIWAVKPSILVRADGIVAAGTTAANILVLP